MIGSIARALVVLRRCVLAAFSRHESAMRPAMRHPPRRTPDVLRLFPRACASSPQNSCSTEAGHGMGARPAADVIWDSVKTIITEAWDEGSEAETKRAMEAVRNAAGDSHRIRKHADDGRRARDRKEWTAAAASSSQRR